jgi:phosphoenolpyruvate carboxylase
MHLRERRIKPLQRHARAIAELSGGEHASGTDRISLPASPSDETHSLLESLRTVADLKREFPPHAIRSYVISGVSKRRMCWRSFGWPGFAACGWKARELVGTTPD